MAAKKAKEKSADVPKARSLANPHAFDHLTPEERFLLFVVPQMGATRAAKCFKLDHKAVAAAWSEFTSDPFPVNLHA